MCPAVEREVGMTPLWAWFEYLDHGDVPFYGLGFNESIREERLNRFLDVIVVQGTRIIEHHGFRLVRSPAVGFDEVVAEVERGQIRLYVGWDNWCGFDILSLSDAGDSIVRELAADFDAHKDDVNYDDYFE